MRLVGETRINDKNQISLPTEVVRELGWQRGEELLVEVLDETMLLLIRKPRDATEWVEAFSGKMGDVFGDHEDNMRYLEEERRGWESE